MVCIYTHWKKNAHMYIGALRAALLQDAFYTQVFPMKLLVFPMKLLVYGALRY